MNIDEEKKVIRRDIRALKKEIPLDVKRKRSEFIINKLRDDESFKQAKVVMLYWSMDDEVYTHDFVIECAKDKIVILPCVKDDVLELRVFTGEKELNPGDRYGILEPKGDLYTDLNNIDLIVVPGVAFDMKNNRMGRGKAYYDRLLNTTTCLKIGICFDFQLLETVPNDKFDIKMDKVLSE